MSLSACICLVYPWEEMRCGMWVRRMSSGKHCVCPQPEILPHPVSYMVHRELLPRVFLSSKGIENQGSPVTRVASDLSLSMWFPCGTDTPFGGNEFTSHRARFDQPLHCFHPGLQHRKAQVMEPQGCCFLAARPWAEHSASLSLSFPTA